MLTTPDNLLFLHLLFDGLDQPSAMLVWGIFTVREGPGNKKTNRLSKILYES